MLEIHRCANPVIPDRLVGVKYDGVSLSNEYFKTVNGIWNMANSVNLEER